jgi:hypothetical protein
VPQLALSVCTSAQAAPHAVWPAGHTQAPATHDCAAEQTLPQAPQLRRSVAVLRHTPLHAACPTGHVHAPLTQREPCAQTVPHAPQLPKSVWVLTQAPFNTAPGPPVKQAVSPALQAGAHAPCEQSGPPAIEPGSCGWQSVPHAPQFAGLDARSTHVLAQKAGRVPRLHWQALFTHC